MLVLVLVLVLVLEKVFGGAKAKHSPDLVCTVKLGHDNNVEEKVLLVVDRKEQTIEKKFIEAIIVSCFVWWNP